MNKICTSIEQSKRLVNLAIDINTADMYYYTVNGDWEWYETPNIIERRDDLDEHTIPAWSLAALLGVLPKGTRLLKSATDDTYHCDCPKGNIAKWFNNSIDAAFEMVCWLKENNKI